MIDVWGTTPSGKGKNYTPDSTTTIFSSGKTVGNMLMAVLFDKGLIRYEEKVCHYWPEFAQHGKENITITDVLRHESGLDKLEVTIEHDWLLPHNIKQNKIGKVIEDTTPFFRKGSVRLYHAMTKDWILNEVFRRVEPDGRTMGEYFDQEVKKQMGDIDVYLGMKEEDLKKGYDYDFHGLWSSMRNGRTSWENGRVVTYPLGSVKAVMNHHISNQAKANKEGAPPNFD